MTTKRSVSDAEFLIGELSICCALYRVVMRRLYLLRAELDDLSEKHRAVTKERDLLRTALSDIDRMLRATPADDSARVRHDVANALQICGFVGVLR